MSVVFVILGFVLICLILVHINLHQKKKELYDFIENANKTLMIRHKKIANLISLLGASEQTNEIRELNSKTIERILKKELLPSQAVKAEVLLEDKMNRLLKSLEGKELNPKIAEAIESYQKTQNKINKNKTKYNEIMLDFLDACSIKPANLYAAFEHIDKDFPTLE